MKVQVVNIPSYIEDPNYRYKMPKPILKIEGKGNGIKTNLLNMHEIAKALKCPDQYPLKFLGFELGSQTIYKFKNENDVTCIINGAFQEELIRKTLDKFIEKYILCHKCKYPEMFIKLKSKIFVGQCDSCGHQSDLDNVHKLAVYIQRNPPENGGQIKTKTQEQKDIEFQDNQEVKLKAKKQFLTEEQLTKDSELTSQLLDSLSQTYSKVTTPDSIPDVKLAELMIAQDVKKFNIGKKLKDRVFFLIFQCMFNETPVKQLDKNKELFTGLIEDLDQELYNTHIMLNIQYLMQRFKIEDKYLATVLMKFYEKEYIEDRYLLQWFDKEEDVQQQLQQHFLYDEKIDEHYRSLSKPMIDWLRQSFEAEYEEEDDVQ